VRHQILVDPYDDVASGDREVPGLKRHALDGDRVSRRLRSLTGGDNHRAENQTQCDEEYGDPHNQLSLSQSITHTANPLALRTSCSARCPPPNPRSHECARWPMTTVPHC